MSEGICRKEGESDSEAALKFVEKNSEFVEED